MVARSRGPAPKRHPFTGVLRPKFPTNGPRVAWFIENYCTHTDGALLGSPMILEPWQRWVLNEMFRIDPTTGLRQWREFVLMVPRGNGKSALASALGFYFLVFDGEGAPEVYSAAWGEDQAGAVFEPAKLMWEASPQLQLVSDKFAKAFTCDAGSWKIVSRIAETKQGKKPYALLNDEYHVHKTPELRDTFIRGMHKRRQPIAIDITTEGKAKSSPLGELQQGFYDAVAAGTATFEQVADYLTIIRAGRSILVRFGVPWDVTDNVDCEDPRIVRACNPLSVIDPQRVIDEQLLAPGKRESDFRTYHLNQLVDNAEAGVPAAVWDNCANGWEPIPHGADVHVGVDLGYRDDWSAVVTVANIDGRLRVQAELFEPPEDGELYLDGTVGVAIDRIARTYRISSLSVDPYMGGSMMQAWQMAGLPVIEYRFQPTRVCPASVKLLETIEKGQLAHDGDRDLRAHVLNLRMRDMGSGAWRFDKPKDDNDLKVDAGMALLMAVDRALDGGNPYQGRGLLIV